MSALPLPPSLVSPPPSPSHGVRVEYLDYQDVGEHREYRFRVYGAGASEEFRLRIAIAAFGARSVRMQDGPDLCYQKLLREIAAGVTAHPDAITIEDDDFVRYQVDHTPVLKRRARPPSPPVTPVVAPRTRAPYRPRTTVSPPAPAPPVPTDVEPALEEGQRVNHVLFGMGVTTSTTSTRTLVSFDQGEPRTFVTSMLQVEVLSAPHTWETNRRGVNRPCKPPAE